VLAEENPHGQGSFNIFEPVLKGWAGKSGLLILLWFAETGFFFTSSIDAIFIVMAIKFPGTQGRV
jgi:hypothetical protein